MLEKHLVRKVMAYLKTVPNLKATKMNLLAHKGFPDIVICHEGKYIEIELKRDEKSKATPKQLYELKKTREAQGIGEVCYTLEQVKKIIENN